METILCAVDLSEAARPVMAVAASLARAWHARLELLHVLHVPPGWPTEFLDGNVILDLRREATAALESRAAALRATGIDVRAVVVPDLVDDGILKHARATNPGLLVIGTHARHGLAHVFIGGTAERIIRTTTWAVVVVPPAARGRLLSNEPLAGRIKIVAGIDLSPASDAALGWLRRIDHQARCDLGLVHLYWPPREHERLGLGHPDPFEAEPEVTAVLARELGTHVAMHLGRADVPLRVRPLWGSEDDPLAWEAETDDADLLVVGTSQRRASTALGAIRGAHLPVVCVPAGRPEVPAGRLMPVRTVLITTDFSPLGNAAIAEGYRLLMRGGGHVVLLHVAEPGPLGLDPDRRNEIETCLLALIPNGMDRYAIRTRTLVVDDASCAQAIIKAIRRVGPDLVVMSSHGRSGLRRAVRGSVAEDVMRASPKPVLVVPASSDVPIESADDRM